MSATASRKLAKQRPSPPIPALVFHIRSWSFHCCGRSWPWGKHLILSCISYRIQRMHPAQYDGVLRRPFLAEHWYKGLVAALAIWLPVFLCVSYLLPNFAALAAGAATMVSLAIIVSVVTQYEGFTLDLPSRRYRCYIWVAGVRLGRWQPLPHIVQVTVRYVQTKHYLSSENDPVELGLIATERVWQVLLRVEHSPVGIVAANTQHEKALRIATTLAALLDTKMVVQTPSGG